MSLRMLAASFLCILVSFACMRPSKETPERQRLYPADFKVVAGEGGGFTGRWHGYSIAADASVYEWDGLTLEQNSKKTKELSVDQLNSLWQVVQQHEFFRRESEQEHGNLTRVLKITANGSLYEYSWVPQIEPVEPPSSLRSFYRTCLELIEQNRSR